MADEEPKIKKEEQPKENPMQSLSEIYDKIKQENDRAEAILKRNEELVARGLLGGKTDAGIQPEPVKPIEGLAYLEEFKKQFKGL